MKVKKLNIFSDDQAVSAKDAAIFLGYSPATLSRWRGVSEGPKFAKISRTSIRYRVSDLKDWLDNLVSTKKLKRS